jgi:hypothetical protein
MLGPDYGYVPFGAAGGFGTPKDEPSWSGAYAGSLWNDFTETMDDAWGGATWLARDWRGTTDALANQIADGLDQRVMADYSVRRGDLGESVDGVYGWRGMITAFSGAYDAQAALVGRDEFGDLSTQERWERGLAGLSGVTSLAAAGVGASQSIVRLAPSLVRVAGRGVDALGGLLNAADEGLSRAFGMQTAVRGNTGAFGPWKFAFSNSEGRVFPTPQNTWWERFARGPVGQGRQRIPTRVFGTAEDLRRAQANWIVRMVDRGFARNEIADRIRASLIRSGKKLAEGKLPTRINDLLDQEFGLFRKGP